MNLKGIEKANLPTDAKERLEIAKSLYDALPPRQDVSVDEARTAKWSKKLEYDLIR